MQGKVDSMEHQMMSRPPPRFQTQKHYAGNKPGKPPPQAVAYAGVGWH